MSHVIENHERGLEAAAGSCAMRTNVGNVERALSVGAGGALALVGLSRRSPLGAAAAVAGAGLIFRGVSGWCGLYQLLGINTACGSQQTHGEQASLKAGEGIKVEKSVVIERSADELYRQWRELENLPGIMKHLDHVDQLGSTWSHWVAKGPLGMKFEWDAEIIEDKPGEMISWRSFEDADVATAGSVHFRPLVEQGATEVRVSLRYSPPAGRVGAAIAKLFGAAPEQEIESDLKSFKRRMEAGIPLRDTGSPVEEAHEPAAKHPK